MKKILLTLLCFILITSSCSSASPDQDPEMVKQMLAEFDSLSFDDAKQKFLEEYEQLSSVLAFMERDRQKKTQKYTLEEEQKNSTFPFTLTHNQLTAQKLIDNITAKHSIPSYYSLALLNGENLEPKGTVDAELSISADLNLGYEASISYVAKKLYYKDGTSKDIDMEARFIGFGLLDSVSLLVTYKSYGDLDTRMISANQKTVTFDNNTIKLEDIDDNYVKYMIEGPIASQYITSIAKTKNDIWVSLHQSSSSPFTPQEAKALTSNIRNKLGKIAEKIEKDKYKTKEDFISDLIASATSLSLPHNKDKRYTEANYNGNVSELYLYFGKDRKKEEFYITIPVEEQIRRFNRFNDSNTGWSGIVDQNGNILIKPDSMYLNIRQINDYYYVIPSLSDEEDDFVYRLDTLNKSFVKQNYTYSDVQPLSNSLLGVFASDKYGAIDHTGKLIIPMNYSSLTRCETEPRIIAYTGSYYSSDRSYTLFDLDGKKINTGIGHLSDFQCGVGILHVEDTEKYTLIDVDGKVLSTLNGYYWVHSFSDNLSRVTKDEKTGYIDKSGKLIIPLIYDEGHDFYCGITLVKKDGEYGLINKQNQVVVPFRACTLIAISGKGKDVSYQLNDEYFNAYGEKVDK